MKNRFIIFLTIAAFVFFGCSSANDEGVNNSIENEHQDETIEHNDEEADHSVIILKKQAFTSVIKTSGRIMVDTKDIILVISKSSGVVKFVDHFLFPGVKIQKGQELFTVSGDQLAGDNTDLNFKQILSDLEEATANYDRSKIMIADKLITEENFLSFKNRYEKALNEYNNLHDSYSRDGGSIIAPEDGYIREVYITEGEKVNPGQPIASIVIEHNIVLKADISPDYLNILPSIEKANFRVSYSEQLFKTEDMAGKKISFGKGTGENSYYIPVYFRMSYNPQLIEGTFAEVYLIGTEIKDAIVVPNSALLEEYGKLFVFVEDNDGDFLKRYVTTGFSDGENTQVLNGLSEDEKIVATGTYQVKLSQMSASAPAHNH